MDGFTAEAMLKAARASGKSIDELATLASSMEWDEKGPALHILINEEEIIGKKVSIKGTDYTGVIDRINKSTTGFYPGHRFPYYVKIDEGCGKASGQVFEYAEDQVVFER